jgi:hypothetical protein
MNVLKRLAKLSTTLTDILDEIDEILEGTDNTDLYNEINDLIRADVDNAVTNLDVVVTDIEDGMYAEDDIEDEDSEDYNY